MTEAQYTGFSFDDRILLGEGLFETIKVRQSTPCFSELHWQRLLHAAQSLSIPFSTSFSEWSNVLHNIIQKDNIIDGGIKVILSGGVAERGLVAQGQESGLHLHGFIYTLATKALRLRQASWLRDANNPIYQFKTVNYLEAILARREAMQEGVDDALFFNTNFHATEATCANLFIITKDAFITPPQQDGVLPGITRGRILKHCARLGLAHAERSISKELLQHAEAVFLTNALQDIQYVVAVDEVSFVGRHPLVERMLDVLAEEEMAILC